MSKKLWSTKAHETPEFVEFWETWRPKARETDGRGLARDTFLEHVQNGADPQDIVDGAKWLIRNFKDFQFLPLSSTWVNRRAYEDLAEQYRAHEARRQERARPQEQAKPIAAPANDSAPQPVISNERRSEIAARARAAAASMRVGA